MPVEPGFVLVAPGDVQVHARRSLGAEGRGPRAIIGPLTPVLQGPLRSLAVRRMPWSGWSEAPIGRIPKLIVRVRFPSSTLIASSVPDQPMTMGAY